MLPSATPNDISGQAPQEMEDAANVKPFEEIALALSGGGFRAAAYSLGCMSYLNRVMFTGTPLIKRVKFISSASGGSITALYYALQTALKAPFENIFQRLYGLLDESSLVESAFDKLQSDEDWKNRQDKARNLINAFALAYDEKLFNGSLLKDTINATDSHLEEICANATDFNYGITFRFQTGSGKLGNGKLSVERATGLRFKLGDILAASSCFPMGFEPIMLPEDFSHSSLACPEITSAMVGGTSAGLMDGGITDNQGIYSFLLAEERKLRQNKRGYDLFIYCDVSSPYMEEYQLPKENKHSIFGKPSVQFYLNTFKFSPFVLAGLICLLVFKTHAWWAIALTTVGSISTILYFISLSFYLRTKRKSLKNRSTWLIIFFKYINGLLSTRTNAVLQMLNARVQSAAILVGDVYLKQIRRLTINSLYESSKSGAKWQKHSIGNFIYELSSLHTSIMPLQCQEIPTRSKRLGDVAESARAMDTTLWFDQFQMKDGKREDIIATGQFTTCYNLIKYLCKVEKNSPLTPELQTMKRLLIEDWIMFNENPLMIARPSDYLNNKSPWL